MNHALEYGFREELAKIAGSTRVAKKKRSTLDRVLATLPAAGATVGGVVGAVSPGRFSPVGLFPKLKGKVRSPKGRAISALIGAGGYGTIGWLPSTFRDAYKAILSSEKKS